jgi:hypothetical protein
VEVTLADKLWDGQEWVRHQGVIYKGQRQVINLCGVEVTPDHLIKTPTTWQQAKTLVSNKNILTLALVTGSANLPFLPLNAIKSAPALTTWLKFNAHAAQTRILFSYTTFVKAVVQGATLALRKPLGIGEKTISNTLTLAPMTRIADVYLTDCRLAKTDAITQTTEAIQTTADVGLRFMNRGELTKLTFYDTFLRCLAGMSQSWNWIVLTLIKGMSRVTFGLSRVKKICSISGQFKKCSVTSLNLKPVFDILNSGSRNRFTILTDDGPLIVHNCGYAGGVGAFAAMGRIYGVLLPESDARRMVDAWRRANPWAVDYWDQLESAYLRAMRNPGHEFTAGRVTYYFDTLHLWYSLPSGRILCYPYARLDADGVSYAKASWKPAADAKEWPRARLWKGLACENICQAAANDVLRNALRQLDSAVLHVHDEIVLEVPADKADQEAQKMSQVMCTPPEWANGLPLDAGVKIMGRYGK